MQKTNIIYGLSTNYTMKDSKILNNNIICFDTPFSYVELSTIDNYEIILPKGLYHKDIKLSYKETINKLNKSIKNKEDIRVWTSHYEINSYLLFLYLCNYLKDKECNIFVIYTDEYDEEFVSPSCLHSYELEKCTSIEHQLTKEDVKKYSNEWLRIKNTKSDMRILENREVKLVSYDYYNDIILEKLKSLGEVRISRLTGLLMSEYYLQDLLLVYLINRLIEDNKIKITKINEEHYFKTTIRIN